MVVFRTEVTAISGVVSILRFPKLDTRDDERAAEAEIVLAPIGDVAVEKLQLTDNAHQTLQLAWTLLFNHECTFAKGSVAAALIDEGT